ncbi:MAG: hypothetical protein HRU70_10690 [Phycisphaeraceae bacterium]|nr:MAG: hypothetical protein HRU70_10690 [Phycisphaeraceae bacterium]
MTYTRKQFARDLLAEMNHGYDVVRIARWAFAKKMDPDVQIEDSKLDAMVMQVVAMEEGPEFEYDEAELRALAQRVLNERDE